MLEHPVARFRRKSTNKNIQRILRNCNVWAPSPAQPSLLQLAAQRSYRIFQAAVTVPAETEVGIRQSSLTVTRLQ